MKEKEGLKDTREIRMPMLPIKQDNPNIKTENVKELLLVRT